ncbi:hypothetical protein STEG23_022842 [Scotinomys teguina]
MSQQTGVQIRGARAAPAQRAQSKVRGAMALKVPPHEEENPRLFSFLFLHSVKPSHQLQMIASHSAMSQQTGVQIRGARAAPAQRAQSKVRGAMALKVPPPEEENPRVKCRDCGAFGHTARSKRCPIKRGYVLPVPQPLEAREEKENQDPCRAQAIQTTGTGSQAERDKKLSRHPAPHKDRQIPNTSLRAPGKKPPRGPPQPGQNPPKKPRLTPWNSPLESNSRTVSKTSSPESQSQSQSCAKSLGGKEAPETGEDFEVQILEVGASLPQLDCTSSSLESVPCPLSMKRKRSSSILWVYDEVRIMDQWDNMFRVPSEPQISEQLTAGQKYHSGHRTYSIDTISFHDTSTLAAISNCILPLPPALVENKHKFNVLHRVSIVGITYLNPSHQLQMIASHSAMRKQTSVQIRGARAAPAQRAQSKVRGAMALKVPPPEEENPRVKCRDCGAFGHTARSKRCPIKRGYVLPVPQPLEAREEKENQDPCRAQAIQTTGTGSQAERDKKLSRHPAPHKDRQIPNTSLRAPGKKPPRGPPQPGQNPPKKPRLAPWNSPLESNSRTVSKTSSPESQSQSQSCAKSLGGKEAPETGEDFEVQLFSFLFLHSVKPSHQLQMIASHSAMSQQTGVQIRGARAAPAQRAQSKVRGAMALKVPPPEEENPRVKCRDCGAFGHTARSKRCPIKRGYVLPVPQPLEAREEKENQDPCRAQAIQTTGTGSQAERDKKLSRHPAPHKDRQIPNTSLRAPGKKPPRGPPQPGQNPPKKPRLTPWNSPLESNSRTVSKTSSPESQSQSQSCAKSLGGKEAPETGEDFEVQLFSFLFLHSVKPSHQLQMIASHSAMSQQTGVQIRGARAAPAQRAQSKVRGAMALKVPPPEEENPRVKCRDCGAFGHTARSKRCPIKRGYVLPVPQPLEAREEKENQDPCRAQAIQTTGTGSQAERDKKLSRHPAPHKDRQIPNTSLRAPGKKPPRGPPQPGQNPPKKPRLTPWNSPLESNSRTVSKTSSPESQSQSQSCAKSLGGKEASETGEDFEVQVPNGTEQTLLHQWRASPVSATASIESREPPSAHGTRQSLKMIFKRLHGNCWTCSFVTEEPALPREKQTLPSESPASQEKEEGAHSSLPWSVLREDLQVSSTSEESDGE